MVRFGLHLEYRSTYIDKPKAMDAVPKLHGIIVDLYELTDDQLAILRGYQESAG